jgi:hypothetical protein
MSAFLCAADTFDLLASAALELAPSYCPFEVHITTLEPDAAELLRDGRLAVPDIYPGRFKVTDGIEASTVARILRYQNLRSLQARYPSDWQDFLQGQPAYRYRPLAKAEIDPVAVLKSCACLEYQSCETDDYDRTLAYKLVKAIAETAIGALPGYEAAPWGWERPEPEARRA